LFAALVNRIRLAISEQKAASAREAAQRAARRGTTSSGSEETPRKKVELNREFFRSLLKLLKIVVPGWRSKESRLLMSHSFFLVLRTLISVRVAEMDGAIVKALVKGNGKEFLKRIVWWMLIAVPATFTNSMVSSIVTYRSIGLLMKHVAIIPPSRVIAQVSITAYATHSRQISIQPNLLRYFSFG
jgi:ATP-binding cassette subfamily D (ALD) long-chain fatty acid import protein